MRMSSSIEGFRGAALGVALALELAPLRVLPLVQPLPLPLVPVIVLVIGPELALVLEIRSPTADTESLTRNAGRRSFSCIVSELGTRHSELPGKLPSRTSRVNTCASGSPEIYSLSITRTRRP